MSCVPGTWEEDQIFSSCYTTMLEGSVVELESERYLFNVTREYVYLGFYFYLWSVG